MRNGELKTIHGLVIGRQRDLVLVVKLVRRLNQVHGRAGLGRARDVLASARGADRSGDLLLEVQLHVCSATKLAILIGAPSEK